tara:strand:- start:290 stop:469 length:180 start_codon:yes stop_codon:yes gene_type:complete
MKILLVGGAGFIGAHMIKHLEDFDYEVEVLDNLSSGFKENVNNIIQTAWDWEKILKKNK